MQQMKEVEQLGEFFFFFEAGDILWRNFGKDNRAEFRPKFWSKFWACYRNTWE